jgi:hypothetical protein
MVADYDLAEQQRNEFEACEPDHQGNRGACNPTAKTRSLGAESVTIGYRCDHYSDSGVLYHAAEGSAT